MIWLLLIATLAAPVLALMFADWMRVRRRRKSKEPGK